MLKFVKENKTWCLSVAVALAVCISTFFIPEPPKEVKILSPDIYWAIGKCRDHIIISHMVIDIESGKSYTHCADGSVFEIDW
jgi:hypothetical protein